MRPDQMPRPYRPEDEPRTYVGTISQIEWEDSDRIVLRIEKDESDVMMWERLLTGARVKLVTEGGDGW